MRGRRAKVAATEKAKKRQRIANAAFKQRRRRTVSSGYAARQMRRGSWSRVSACGFSRVEHVERVEGRETVFALARDHEPCERRVALWQHSAVSPRHGLRRCLASRATTAAPAGAPSAGHEHGPKARHEMTKIPFCSGNSLMRLIL